MKAAFAARINLVTQAVKVTNFSYCRERLELGEKPTKKLLACSALKESS